MVDAALVQQCADPGLKPAIIEKFIAAAGSADPFAMTVRAGGRVVLVPPPKSPDEALELVRRYVGHAVVRVGITQYPAGVGVTDPSQLTADLVDPCKNIRMGTALFGKVYRIVVKWYGIENDNAFEDAIIAWRTGTFEDVAVFSAPDPGQTAAPPRSDEVAPRDRPPKPSAAQAPESDPNRAGIRIDLSGIGGVKPNDKPKNKVDD
ncbi:MAG: conjugal transfer protein TraH [Xanthobacteraceae bacterium]|nr:conjugal transfer protein TraH [Xanthobacteraceae bacterium]